MNWNGSPYHTLDFEMKSRFGQKVYKIALDGRMTCPNRDGTLGTRGCIFCSEGGSGDFAAPLDADISITTAVNNQIEEAISRVKRKMGSAPDAYIAYFQSYTNTYAPLSYLEALFTAAIRHPKIVALSIGTRPDYLPDEVLDLCARVNREKPVWLELGLQTIHEDTAVFIRRGYPLSVFTQAVYALAERNIPVVVHIILGLPGESRETVLPASCAKTGHHCPRDPGTPRRRPGKDVRDRALSGKAGYPGHQAAAAPCLKRHGSGNGL